ncbi:MAG: 16S rRNA (uracil(1498)-N(3))-methyltransferase, partial [Marinobacter sp.]|nr:16S rRNA (uracil(1498)-N(3))-methyltransferase [Marinobacter sp.]
MNLALLFDEDFVATDRAVLRGRRLAHLQSVIKVVAGDTVPVGRADGQLGTGEVIRLTDNEAELRVTLDQAPPPPLPLTLILAMP